MWTILILNVRDLEIMPDEIASVLKGDKVMAKWPLRGRDVAGDLMLLDLIVVHVHCIVCIVCGWRSHDYLVVRI